MNVDNIKEYDFTRAAKESLHDAMDSTEFIDSDAQYIYNSLKNNLKLHSFGDYLRRYIYVKAELSEPFSEVPLKEYQSIIRSSFSDNLTPSSFTPSTAKLSALSKNWLTGHTVRRNVVFLLGFGLGMSTDDVNMFLTKALYEQEINPKNPFEVICWYCYHNHFNYLKFQQLWKTYNELRPVSSEYPSENKTVNARDRLHAVSSDEALISHLAGLKTDINTCSMSYTSRKFFNLLYTDAKKLVAQIYNHCEDEKYEIIIQDYAGRLSRNDKLYDTEKQEKIKILRCKKKIFTENDITEGDIERIICSAIPTDGHGNLTPGKLSDLNDQFDGKRFSRQRISTIISGNSEVSRFDLITLNFFIFSQKIDKYPDPKNRYMEFVRTTDEILEACSLGKLYVQNPYECFVLMCLLSEEPLSTYADVWELSYDN